MIQNSIEKKKLSLSVTQVITGLFALIVIVVGATYLITKDSISDNNEALKTVNEHLDKELESYKKKDSKIPIVTMESTSDSTQVKELFEKINKLEKERDILYKELIATSYSALDPKSELQQLLKALKSKDENLRKDALKALFMLKDSNSLEIMRKYYFDNLDEFSNGFRTMDWINFMWDINYDVGIDFTIDLLQLDEPYTSEYAFTFLKQYIVGNDLMNKIINKLKPVALTSESTIVRTRAKYIIKEYNYRIETDDKHDSRSIMNVLLDIEKLLKEKN